MVDAKVVAEEGFYVELLCRDDYGCVAIKGDEKVMRLVDQEG